MIGPKRWSARRLLAYPACMAVVCLIVVTCAILGALLAAGRALWRRSAPRVEA